MSSDDASRCNRLSEELKQTGSGAGRGSWGNRTCNAKRCDHMSISGPRAEAKAVAEAEAEAGSLARRSGSAGALLDGVADMHAACRVHGMSKSNTRHSTSVRV